MKSRPGLSKEVSWPLRSGGNNVDSSMKNPTIINGDGNFTDQFPEVTILKRPSGETTVSSKNPSGSTEQIDSAKSKSSNSKEAIRHLRSAMKAEDAKMFVPVNGERKTKEDTPSDLSILKKSMVTSISGPQDILKAIDSGTTEVAELLRSECYLIYECKVCRNLFRSVANFITHKRSYCVEKFCPAEQLNGVMEHAMALGTGKGVVTAGRKTSRRDILSLLERCQKGINGFDGPPLEPDFSGSVSPNPSPSAIFNGSKMEETAAIQILGSEGRVIGWRRSATTVSCRTCPAEFTDCTLLDIHAEKCTGAAKATFGCPCCPKHFSSAWSVYRHLRRYHGKNNDQVLKLRSLITKQCVPISDKKFKKSMDDNKASDKMWMDQIFTDPMGLKQCYVCGRQFERKAALASHLVACKRKRTGVKAPAAATSTTVSNGSIVERSESIGMSNGPTSDNVRSSSSNSTTQAVTDSRVIADDLVILDEEEDKDGETTEQMSEGDYLPQTPEQGNRSNSFTLSPTPMEDEPISLAEDVLNEIHLRESNEVTNCGRPASDEETRSPSSTSSLSSASAGDDSDSEEAAAPLLPYLGRDHCCRICGLTYDTKAKALRHVAEHLGVARFRCAVASCSFQAYSRHDVRQHILLYHKINKACLFVSTIPREEMFNRDESNDFLGFEASGKFCPPPFFQQFTTDNSGVASG